MAGILDTIRLRAIVGLIRTMSWVRRNYVSIPRTWDSVLEIPSRQEGRTIEAHVYKPKGEHVGTASPSSPSPVLINFHGSGFILPLFGSDDTYCNYVATHTHYITIDVPYRLAPENPFPAAVEDAEDALRHVLAHPETYDPKRIALSGFSAGGNLALVLASTSGGNIPQNAVKKCVAVYPVVDISVDPATKKAPEVGGKQIPVWIANMFDGAYAPQATTDRNDPRISPLLADPQLFCDEVFVVTCGGDALAPEGEALAAKLKAVPGKKVGTLRIEKVNHGWDKIPENAENGVEKRDRAYAAIVEMLNE